VEDSAATEIQKPDSYYLTPCEPLPASESDELRAILDLITLTISQYDDCYNRHNGLVEQVK